MKSVKGHQGEEEEEEDDYDFGSNKDALPSTSNTKDGKSNDKAYAIRSKHSVTEQRRRSKINERFQMLRNLIPNTDQKRDTASFLLEVIQYVQHLQEKVDKYEGSHQPWSSETAKLMPWVNSPAATFTGRFDKNLETGQNDNAFSESLHRRTSDECPSSNINALNHQEEFMIEGGTISISSAYSQGLLNSLTQALQATGLDLSEATISVHVNLGRPANRESENPPPAGNQFREANNDEASDHAQKRLKI